MSAVQLRPLVVDASVVVKWLVVEPRTDIAERLYDAALAAQQPIVAPTLLPNEVTNAIYRQLRRGNLAENQADAAVARFAAFDSLLLLSPADLPRQAYEFAKRHRLGAIYDSLYVVLAERLGTDLWTDDRRLLNMVGAAAPWVRWLGDYPAVEAEHARRPSAPR